MKTYTLFTVLYFNLEAHSIALVLRFSGANNLITKPFRIEVEVDNVFVTAVIFNSFRNYKVC